MLLFFKNGFFWKNKLKSLPYYFHPNFIIITLMII